MAVKTVEIIGFEYVPNKVVINVGDSVKWINRDPPPNEHDAKRDLAPTFSINLLKQGEKSEPIQFNQASGNEGFKYSYSPHPFRRLFINRPVLVAKVFKFLNDDKGLTVPLLPVNKLVQAYNPQSIIFLGH